MLKKWINLSFLNLEMIAELLFSASQMYKISAYYCHLVDTQIITPSRTRKFPSNRSFLSSSSTADTENLVSGEPQTAVQKMTFKLLRKAFLCGFLTAESNKCNQTLALPFTFAWVAEPQRPILAIHPCVAAKLWQWAGQLSEDPWASAALSGPTRLGGEAVPLLLDSAVFLSPAV